MKFFNKRSATAMLLAVAMMSTSISSVFAEGSRELVTVPDSTSSSELSANRAVRPYLEWKDRNQFGMASKNVIHVYAKAGETIFFGSDVTEANDRSIEAVVRESSGFTTQLSSDGKDWAGSSIAVTLPSTADANVAFDPESDAWTVAEIESMLLDGNELVNQTSANQSAVYLFQPTENGAGHIANPTMEEKGPNGVDGTTDGYEPLSFVAPVTGTYSFRFLSREYNASDKVLIPLKDTASLASKSIDFQGSLGELTDGAIKANKSYYEPDYGDNITIYGESGRHNTAVTMTENRTAPATAYSGEVTYYAGQDNYLTISKNQTNTGGAIGFVPLHDDVELEIVWRSLGSNSTQTFYAAQNGHGETQSDRITVTTTGDMQVTRISNSGGYPIEAGSELKLYAQNNSNHGIEIYEIRYYYNRVDVSNVETASEPTPTPTPSPEPIEYVTTVDLLAFSEMSNYQDKVSTVDGLYEITLYGAPASETGNKDRGFAYTETSVTAADGTAYSYGYNQYAASSFLNFTDGAPTDATAGVIGIVPKTANAKVEIVWSDAADNYRTKLYSTTDGTTSTEIANQHITSSGTRTPVTTTVSLTKDTPTYLYFDRQNAYVHAINYILTDEYPFDAVSESIDYTTLSADYTEDYTVSGTLTDELYDMTFYSADQAGDGSNNRGFKYRTMDDEVTVGETTYTESLYQNAAGTFLNMTDDAPTDTTAGVIAVTPKYENAKIEFVIKNGNDSDVSVNATGAVTGTYGSVATGENGSITTDSLPVGKTTYLYFDQSWTDILEIIYHFEGTATDTATVSEFALFSEDSAETAYAEWTLTGSYSSDSPAGTDGYLPDGTTAATVLTRSASSVATAPELYYSRTPASTRANASSSYRGETATFTTLGGETITASKALKTSGGYGYTLVIDPKLAENDADSYDLTIAYWSNQAETATNLKVVEIDTAAFGKVANGTAIGTAVSENYNNLVITTVEGLTKYASFGFDAQPGLAYVGIEYTISDDTTEDTETTTTTSLTPVSNKYTWDFYNMKGLGTNNTYYSSDMLVGEYPNGEDGTDYDYSYTYDMMVHASETVPVTINNGTLFMYWGGTFNSDGTPDAGVLEFIPYWSGEVTVSFNHGNVQIKQLNGAESEIVTSTGNNDTQKVTLTVEAGKPVYIYPTGGSCSSYIRGVKYVPDEPETGMERGVDEKWAVTGSMVAAWDITVAQGGGQTVEGDVHTWDVANELYTADGSDTTVDGLTKHGSGSISGETSTLNGAQVSGLKMNEYYNESYSNNYLSYTPDSSGTITVHAYSGTNSGTRYLNIEQNGSVVASALLPSGYIMTTCSANVAAGAEVRIYSTDANADNGTWFCYAVGYAEDSYYSDGYVSIPGRAWADIFFLNAGNYKASIYPQLNILTKEGFLYDFYMNGVQPYGFVFYSNNRGFLFDRWSLYSNPELSGQTSTTERLQSLEHSFYSWSSGSDVGTPPVHIEKDGNNNPIVYNGNIMQSTIDGNYIPVDETKDSTHKMFFNSPENNTSVLNAYTGLTSLRTINASESVYESLLADIEYVGLGNAARNDEDDTTVNYGTVGIGGRFELTVNASEATVLESLGANSVSILLDFSSYDLDETGTAPVPVLADDGTWATTSSQTDAEKNNRVSLSTVVNGAGNYTLAWDGRDAYGNVVPEGEYTDNIKSFVEMGMAHFPILDAEHNPNGFKVEMVNEGNSKSTYLYYNNEAVAPKVDANDPSAWYFTSWSQKAYEYLPSKIGDGQNMVAGWDTNTQGGAMTYGEYSADIEGSEDALAKVYAGLNSGKGKAGGDGGYGNYTAIDMWSMYEREANQNLAIGVAPIVDLKPYVSFVAIDGKVTDGTLPFKVSHVGYSGQVLEEYEGNLGDAINDTETAEKFGHTISTGFVAKLSSASGFTNSQVAWNVTIPVSGTLTSTSTDESGNTTTTSTTMPTFIKIPDGTVTTQEDVDEAEYLAYEMYSGLFDSYAIADDEVNVGDEADPDWNSDASLNEDGEPGIMDTPDSAESANDGITDESYIEAMSLSDTDTTAGDYDGNGYWDVTFNVSTEATLTDVENSINKGSIYQVAQIGDSDTGKANIKLRYSLPTTISGSGTVVLGLVIDNLYAPGSEATATFGSSDLDEYHDITSLLTGESNAIQATSFSAYENSSNNEYETGKTISAEEASKIDYVMDFRGDGTSVTVDGTEFAQSTYVNASLFNGNVTFNNARYDNTHGISGCNTYTVNVPGSVDITVGTCGYNYTDIVLYNASGEEVGRIANVLGKYQDSTNGKYGCYPDSDGSVTLSYSGEATTLTLKFEAPSDGGSTSARFWLPYLRVTSN